MIIPPLYAVVDAEVLHERGVHLHTFAVDLRAAGVSLIQYRNKPGAPQDILAAASCLRQVFTGLECQLILNDRPDVAVIGNADGVHVGQEDLSPADTRKIIGTTRILGVSTHDEAQLRAADVTSADYIAIGPVFPTGTKLNPDPVVGLEGVRRARALTSKPLVAIGGITRANARSVIEAGADSVAVISGLFAPGESVAQVVRDFLDILR